MDRPRDETAMELFIGDVQLPVRKIGVGSSATSVLSIMISAIEADPNHFTRLLSLPVGSTAVLYFRFLEPEEESAGSSKKKKADSKKKQADSKKKQADSKKKQDANLIITVQAVHPAVSLSAYREYSLVSNTRYFTGEFCSTCVYTHLFIMSRHSIY